MSMPAVYFSHGQESGPWGTKIRSMAETVRALGCRAESVDYQGIAEPGARVDKLLAACEGLAEPPLLVGSSMGGYVATAAAGPLRARGVFVLAPAYFMPGFDNLVPPSGVPLAIVHGWRDDVVPVDNSIRFAAACRATLHVVDGDHRLAENIDEINAWLRQFIGQLTGTGQGR
ncbi:MAG: alpha/beta fold hydrolase [Woeseiaceae bacterium]|nr:alpha/beta fold hydrolase [Woeseiaceae bacterium]